MRKALHKRITAFALALMLALPLWACLGCSGGGHGPDIIIDIPGDTDPTRRPSEGGDEATPAPTAEPAPDSPEALILSGQKLALGGGAALSLGFEEVLLDIDGDGEKERLSVETVDGGDTFCIDGEPFLDGGLIVTVASPEGRNMLFLAEKPGEEGFRAFYPDEGGNLYCRLFGIAKSGSAAGFALRDSYEEQIKSGMDIMLHNPMIYSEEDGLLRTLRIDMDGDGSEEEIVFDSALLTVNGQPNAKILSTTMPRFTWDAEHGAIVISGSAGDYALSLRLEDGALVEDINYAQLL